MRNYLSSGRQAVSEAKQISFQVAFSVVADGVAGLKSTIEHTKYQSQTLI
jgi:hypothetical protein